MKFIYTCFVSLILAGSLTAQNGLEGIIVEKYYISNENDKIVDGDGGELPVNSVTYRVYVDMLPGYIFQAAYGVPDHELRIATTTRFFNNQDRGARFPTYTRSQAQNNTVMLDSWLSVGGSLKDYAGVLKVYDDGENTIVNADGVLQNDDPEAGIPLTIQDGAVLSPIEPVTVVGFFDTDLIVLDDANDAPMPHVISTNDGAWSSLNGSRGSDTTENIVLIGQFTTDGVFEFELNLQIRNQQTLGVENYVAQNPIADEILFEELTYNSEVMSSVNHNFNWSDNISLFPNPTTDFVNVLISDSDLLQKGANTYRITSLDGTMVKNGKLSGPMTSIDMQHTAPGVYLFSLITSEGSAFTTKFIRIR